MAEKQVFGKRAERRAHISFVEEAIAEMNNDIKMEQEAAEKRALEEETVVQEDVKVEPETVEEVLPEVVEEAPIVLDETVEEVKEEVTPTVEEPIEVPEAIANQPIIIFDDEEEVDDEDTFEEELEPIVLTKEDQVQEELEPIILLDEEVDDTAKELESIKSEMEEKEANASLRVDGEEQVEYGYDDDIKFNEEDLFYEKKGFLLTQYEKTEKYLEKKSLEGYHFVRKVGKKYYFVQGVKDHFYYNIAYFKKEPTDEQWAKWEKQGWKLVCRAPSKKRKEAGWFFFRHRDSMNEYRRTIENEEEKYDFFRRYANSCRTTSFFLFICMAVCAVSAFLQWKMSGYWIGIIACGVIFFFAFILFLNYLRMLFVNRRTAKKLRVQLRLQTRRKNFHGEDYDPETDAQLATDWNEIETEKKSKKKRRRK